MAEKKRTSNQKSNPAATKSSKNVKNTKSTDYDLKKFKEELIQKMLWLHKLSDLWATKEKVFLE